VSILGNIDDNTIHGHGQISKVTQEASLPRLVACWKFRKAIELHVLCTVFSPIHNLTRAQRNTITTLIECSVASSQAQVAAPGWCFRLVFQPRIPLRRMVEQSARISRQTSTSSDDVNAMRCPSKQFGHARLLAICRVSGGMFLAH
jgi:hypothetical protein